MTGFVYGDFDHKNNHNFWKESNETMEGFANKHVLQCNYTSHKQSDLCKQLHHTVKRYKANKRFFRCKQCHRRTVSYERLPTAPCMVSFFWFERAWQLFGTDKWSNLLGVICKNTY